MAVGKSCSVPHIPTLDGGWQVAVLLILGEDAPFPDWGRRAV